MATVVYYEKEATQCCGNGSLLSRFKKNENKQSRLDPYYGEKQAENLNEMSVKEREYILEDIHGVADAFEETPAFLDEQLELLNKSIERNGNKVAFDTAMRMDPSYVINRDFRLLFLRAENFNIEKTARKLINHFDMKLQLFGEEKLVKDITFDDLDVEDKASLCSGSHQYLGTRDRRGRHVVFYFIDLIRGATFENFARARWYQYMIQLSESNLRHGMVFVVFGFHTGTRLRNSVKFNALVADALPVKSACIHVCLINRVFPKFKDSRNIFQFMNKECQVRVRFHIEGSTLLINCLATAETAVSLLYTLQSFGIDPATVPLGTDGKPQTKLFFELLEKRKLFERQRQCETIKRIENPKPMNIVDIKKIEIAKPINIVSIEIKSKDVILGRGKGQNHPGNLALDRLIDLEIDAHKKAPSQFHKSCIVLATVKRVQTSGGRFLKYDLKNNGWIVADDSAARTTVSTRFRNKARKAKSNPVKTSVKTDFLNNELSQYAPEGKQSCLNHQQQIQFQLEVLRQSQLQLKITKNMDQVYSRQSQVIRN